jgi:hypothetical protein
MSSRFWQASAATPYQDVYLAVVLTPPTAAVFKGSMYGIRVFPEEVRPGTTTDSGLLVVDVKHRPTARERERLATLVKEFNQAGIPVEDARQLLQ